MRRAKRAPHHDILVPHRRLLALFRPPPDPRRNALPTRRLYGVRARGEQLPLGIPRPPGGARGEPGARGVEQGRMRQQRLRRVGDQLVRDRRAGRAVADAPVDELEGVRVVGCEDARGDYGAVRDGVTEFDGVG